MVQMFIAPMADIVLLHVRAAAYARADAAVDQCETR